MVTEIINSITGAITGFTKAIPAALKDGFSNLIYENPEATEKTLSGFAQFGLIFMGISMVCGLTYLVINMVRRKN